MNIPDNSEQLNQHQRTERNPLKNKKQSLQKTLS